MPWGDGGTLKLRIAGSHEHNNGSRSGVRVTIGDTGSGISPEIRQSIFEPFVGTKGDTGTGLGLWIGYEIVRKHGGTIQVKSRAHSAFTGTVFSVFLPLSATAVTAAAHEKYELSNLQFNGIVPDSNHEEVTLVQAERIA